MERESTCFSSRSSLCVSREFLMYLGAGINQWVRGREVRRRRSVESIGDEYRVEVGGCCRQYVTAEL